LFALRQNFAAYEFLLKQIAECDGEIKALLTTLAAQLPPPSAPLPTARRKRRRTVPGRYGFHSLTCATIL
jgi:hypothetical protein